MHVLKIYISALPVLLHLISIFIITNNHKKNLKVRLVTCVANGRSDYIGEKVLKWPNKNFKDIGKSFYNE